MYMRALVPFAAAAALLLSFSTLSAQDVDRAYLPMPDAPFKGKIGLTPADSVKDFPKPVTAPEGAPNVLIIITDDAGEVSPRPRQKRHRAMIVGQCS